MENLPLAILIAFIALFPCVIPRVDFNSEHPAPAGMTSSAMVAVQMAAHSVWPLKILAFFFASMSVLLPAAERIRNALLVQALHCLGVSFICLTFARMCPLTLLSIFPISHGVLLFLTFLSSFFSFVTMLPR